VEIRLGVANCPSDTAQVVFFTNDSFFAAGSDDLAEDLCLVVRDSPSESLLRAPEDDTGWFTDRNFRLTAVGTSGDGMRVTFTTTSLLSDALATALAISDTKPIPEFCAALDRLRVRSGSKLSISIKAKRRRRKSNS
jgi:hypothetical protein